MPRAFAGLVALALLSCAGAPERHVQQRATTAPQQRRTSQRRTPEQRSSSIVPQEILNALEAERGLAFLQAPRVEEASPEEMAERVRAGVQRERVQRWAEMNVALGLLRSAESVTQTAEGLAGAIAGVYEPRSDTLLLPRSTVHKLRRGLRLSPRELELITHELVHALQDQHFDLLALEAAATTFDASVALDLVVEGDAIMTSERVVRRLRGGEADAPMSELPPFDLPGRAPLVLELAMYLPYWAGPFVVEQAHTRGGNAAVDALLQASNTTFSLLRLEESSSSMATQALGIVSLAALAGEPVELATLAGMVEKDHASYEGGVLRWELNLRDVAAFRELELPFAIRGNIATYTSRPRQ